MKALVRWATGKRLTNRLPKLSLTTLSPPLNSGILGLCMGLYVPTPKFFYNLWGPRESDSSEPYNTLPPFEQRDSWSSYGAVRAYSEVLFWGPSESDSSDWKPIVISRAGSCPADDAICEGISPLGYW